MCVCEVIIRCYVQPYIRFRRRMRLRTYTLTHLHPNAHIATCYAICLILSPPRTGIKREYEYHNMGETKIEEYVTGMEKNIDYQKTGRGKRH